MERQRNVNTQLSSESKRKDSDFDELQAMPDQDALYKLMKSINDITEAEAQVENLNPSESDLLTVIQSSEENKQKPNVFDSIFNEVQKKILEDLKSNGFEKESSTEKESNSNEDAKKVVVVESQSKESMEDLKRMFFFVFSSFSFILN